MAASRERHKPFKGSKRKKDKGRTGAKKTLSIKPPVPSKANRKNAAKILQKSKQAELLDKNRIFFTMNVPKNILVVPLCADVCATKAVSSILRLLGSDINNTGVAPVLHESSRFSKNRLLFIPCERNLMEILRLSLVADGIVFLVSASLSMDEWAEQCQSALRSQGLPNIFPVLQYLSNIENEKNLYQIRKDWSKYFKDHYGDDMLEGKIYSCEHIDDVRELERILCQKQLRPIRWRDNHPYMLTCQLSKFGSDSLILSGYTRGTAAFSPDRMVHLTGIGDFILEKIHCDSIKKAGIDMNSDCSVDILLPKVEKPKIDEVNATLYKIIDADKVYENSGNEFSSEMDISNPSSYLKRRKLKGISEYQAAWIPEDELEYEEVSDSEINSSDTESSSIESISDNNKRVHFENSDDDDDMQLEYLENEPKDLKSEALENYKSSSARDLRYFPDRIDLPENVSARERLAKYRSIKNFRHGTWEDQDVDLPAAYKLLVQFSNKSESTARAFQEAKEGTTLISPGSYVHLHLSGLSPNHLELLLRQSNIVVFGILKHEDRISLLHASATRTDFYPLEPLRSKEPFVCIIGYRRYVIQPLFSEFSSGELHRFIRYVGPKRSSPGNIFVISFYGHVQFGSPPCLLLKAGSIFPQMTYNFEPVSLVTTGVLDDLNPSRVIIKRVTLTGDPFKIHRQSAVVRHMFSSPEDVKYFMAVPLMTKSGRRGHIRESLGIHGYMKVAFDKPILQNDTVCLHLYKRVFPKWNTLPFNN